MMETNALKQVTLLTCQTLAGLLVFASPVGQPTVFFVRETCLTSSTRMNANMEGRKETMTCLHTVVKVSTNRGIQKVDCHRVRVLSCFMSYNEQTDTHKACSKQITPWTEEEHGKHRNVKCLPHNATRKHAFQRTSCYGIL